MTFTYTPGSTTSATRVRLLVGDTDPTAPLQERLEDEEITDLLAIYGGYRAAAAGAAEALAGKFARSATNKKLGQAELAWKRFDQLSSLAKSLRSTVSLAAIPFAGGISIAQKQTLEQDTDRVTPSFQKGMLDNPSAVRTTST